ncbi:MAG: hypothetical protein ABJA16_01560 [Nakamurella sp.]
MLSPSPVQPAAHAALDDLSGFTPGQVVGEYSEPLSGRHFVVAEPAAQPALWAAYLEGARRNYRQHGVESAIEYGEVRDGRSTALFVAATDGTGRVVGGLRVQSRLTRPDQAHALREWAGRPGTTEMIAQINQRLPSGVIEVKAVWVEHDIEHKVALTAALARAFVHTMDLLRVRYALCTAAAHAVTRWQTSGGVVSTTVSAVAYPDERYRTRLMWWDRSQVPELLSHDQLIALTRESDLLFARSTTASTLPSVA